MSKSERKRMLNGGAFAEDQKKPSVIFHALYIRKLELRRAEEVLPLRFRQFFFVYTNLLQVRDLT